MSRRRVDPIVAALFGHAGGGPAVVHGSRTWEPPALLRAVARVARTLRGRGLAPGERVAVDASRAGPEVLAALLGARAAGATVLPLPRHGAAGLLARYSPAMVLGGPAGATAGGRVPWSELLAGPEAEPVAEPGPDPGWVLSTSGSSGRPRLVALPASGVGAVTASIQEVLQLRPADRIGSALPLFHSYGLSQLWLACRTGAALHLARGPALPGELLRLARACTVFPAVPDTAASLVRAAGSSGRPAGLLEGLRLVTLAGQATPPGLRRRLAAALPSAAFVVCYGLTEACTRVLMLPPSAFLRHPRATGLPIACVSVELRDGELLVRGPNVAMGYLGDPGASARRLRGGALHTGDLFEERDGYLCFLGRADGVFKRGGEKVVPERVESVLAGHPGVAACLVGPEGDPPRVVAWMLPSGAARPDLSELRRRCYAELPPAMVPDDLRWVAELPRTATGKIRRRPR